MCGITGYIDPASSSADRTAVVARMCQAIGHRGPDDSGIVTSGAATLGHRRLAVMDPAQGHQPMATPDRRFQGVFNGAIYNFRELRSQLIGAGFSFHTQSDTEVLLAAYVHWGSGCLDRFRGMFAFAIWDAHDETLFLARDPFGIKPLYYWRDGARFLFASELGAFHAANLFPLEIDPRAIADYLGWLAVPSPRTLYRHAHSLGAGEALTFRRGECVVQARTATRSASASANADSCGSQAEFNAELRRRLEDTVRAHVIADVPVGAFLSGGLDSAVIAALTARALGSKLKTFSIGFNEPDLDESQAAAATARWIGTDHHTRILSGAELAADLPRILAGLDQPTGDGLNTYYASHAARSGGVIVALSGLGADELFGGYPSFRDIPRYARWLPVGRAVPNPIRRQILARLAAGGTRARKAADLLEHARNFTELCALQRRVFPKGQAAGLLSPEARAAAGSSAPYHPALAALADEWSGRGAFDTISGWELRTYMTDVLLRDSDTMSMRHSLELRVPFVDRPLIEWLWQQPARFREDRNHPKSALAAAAADLLPPGLQSRRKRGFTLPMAQWMRSDLKPFLEATFSNASVDHSGLFARKSVRQLWQNHLAGDDSRQWSRVWSLAVLIDFANRRRSVSSSAPTAPITIASPVNAPRSPDAAPREATAAPTGVAKSRGRSSLLLAPDLFSTEGGIPRCLQLHLKALCELAGPRDTVRFVSLNDRTIDAADLQRLTNERLAEWRACAGGKARFILAALALSRGCDRLICGHVAQLPVALLAQKLTPNLRYALVAHGIEVWRPFTLAERRALRRASAVFCVSEFTRTELLRRCDLPADRAIVLPNALDPSLSVGAGSARNGGPPVILAVSRLTHADRYKGVEHLIAAMPAVRHRHPAAVLRIIGRGDDTDRLRRLRDQFGLADAVTFLGPVDDRRLSEELCACSLFALPSGGEGFGLVYIEAMAHGRPCIGAQAGGTPEIITPDTGLLVEFGNVPALAGACSSALERKWDEALLLKRADDFSYRRFKERLALALDF